MLIKDAVVLRIKKLCRQREISYTALARAAAISPSTVYSVLNPSRREININTIQKLCEGFEISIKEFFDDEIFENL